MSGYIKLHRSINEWGWKRDPKMVALWVHLLVNANHKPSRFRGHDVPKGGMIFGINSLAQQTGLSPRSVRTSLKHLENDKQISIKTTNKFSILVIENWDKFQTSDIQTTNKNDEERHSNDIQTTTSKEGKKERKDIDDDCYARAHTDEKTNRDSSADKIKKIYQWCESELADRIGVPLIIAPVAAWVAWGADLELDVQPVVRKWKAQNPEKPIRSLKWLDDQIASSIDQRSASPPPPPAPGASAAPYSGGYPQSISRAVLKEFMHELQQRKGEESGSGAVHHH